jgi:hypothetical protein
VRLLALLAVAALPVMLIPAVPGLMLPAVRLVIAEPSPTSGGVDVGVKASTDADIAPEDWLNSPPMT